jgi:tetratricopeptide (TPR) repeat protein
LSPRRCLPVVETAVFKSIRLPLTFVLWLVLCWGPNQTSAAESKSHEARMAAAANAFNKGNLQACFAIYDDILKTDPHNEEVLYQRAHILFWKRKFQDAIDDLNKCKSNNQKYLVLRGKCYCGLGQYKKAAADMERVLKLTPKHLSYLRDLSMTNIQAEQYSTAMAEADRLANFVPHAAEAFGIQSLAHAFAGDSIGAAKLLGQYFFCKRFVLVNVREQAVPPARSDRDPGFNSYLNFMWIFEFNALKNLATQSINSQPREAKHYVTRALLYFYVQNYQLAVNDAEKAISLAPSFWAAYMVRAVSLAGLHQYDPALADAQKAIELMPNENASYDILDVVYYEMNSREKVTAALDKLAKKHPNNIAIALTQGSIAVQTDERAKALSILTGSLKLKPNSVQSLIARGEVYQTEAQFDQALTDFDNAVRNAPNNGRALLDRGTIYVQKGETLKALADLNRTLQLDYDVRRALIARAVCYDKLGKHAEALKDRDEARTAIFVGP